MKRLILLIPLLLLLMDPIAVKSAAVLQATDTPTPTLTPVVIPTWHLSSRITYGDASMTIVINLLCLVVLIQMVISIAVYLRRDER